MEIENQPSIEGRRGGTGFPNRRERLQPLTKNSHQRTSAWSTPDRGTGLGELMGWRNGTARVGKWALNPTRAAFRGRTGTDHRMSGGTNQERRRLAGEPWAMGDPVGGGVWRSKSVTSSRLLGDAINWKARTVPSCPQFPKIRSTRFPAVSCVHEYRKDINRSRHRTRRKNRHPITNCGAFGEGPFGVSTPEIARPRTKLPCLKRFSASRAGRPAETVRAAPFVRP
jgi:hypothetical protein